MLILTTTVALSGTLVLFPIPGQSGGTAPATVRELAPEPKLRLPMNGDFFRGTVTDLTHDMITLRLTTGQIRKFPIGSILRSGRYWDGEQPETYRLGTAPN
jgi:hypothetical protein